IAAAIKVISSKMIKQLTSRYFLSAGFSLIIFCCKLLRSISISPKSHLMIDRHFFWGTQSYSLEFGE
ncbi:MAG: hypothetical protein ACK54M_07960, partial [Pseudanabaena sp.]